MSLRIVTWKGEAILVSEDKALIYTGAEHKRKAFETLKQAVDFINQNAEPYESEWDIIKKAVRKYKAMNQVYKSTYLGDDDRGIDNKMRLDLYFDGIYDYLKERKCLHLVYPNYYNSRDEVVA
jgi:hypothetical protein